MKQIIQYTLLGLSLCLGTMLRAEETEKPPLEGIIEIEDTSTTVALVASVHLSVGKLEMRGGKLTGNYSTRVPLRTSKNEDGLILLDYEHGFEHLKAHGGTLEGVGTCPEKPGEERPIKCVVIPDDDNPMIGKIELDISTTERTMNFVSNYRILKIDDNELAAIPSEPAQP